MNEDVLSLKTAAPEYIPFFGVSGRRMILPGVVFLLMAINKKNNKLGENHNV